LIKLLVGPTRRLSVLLPKTTCFKESAITSFSNNFINKDLSEYFTT